MLFRSSNNGAVKNIVDELPQIPDKKDNFEEAVGELMDIHYFDNIANARKSQNIGASFRLRVAVKKI